MSLRLLLISIIILLVPASQAQDPLTLESPTPRAPGLPGQFGATVEGISDIDGDGRGDLIVGAFWEAGLAGSVHLYSGATGELIRTVVSPTPSSSGSFGLDVSSVPDLDGDGIPDIVVGTSSEGSSATGFGRAHVFSGASGTLLYSLISPNPEGAGESFPSFGSAVAGVSDIDGDGRGDVVVGARAEDTGDAGRAYLFSGSSGDLLRTYSSPNPESSGLFGFRVDGVPDTDGDGVPDVLIAAHVEDGVLSNQGRVYLFSGATGDLLITFESPNPTLGGLFGRHIAGVDDANGDGRGDVLVGATGDLLSGRAYLFSGDTGALIHTFVSPNPRTGGFFGAGLGVTADLDGDGVSDILVGAPFEFDGAIFAGRAYVYSGSTGALLNSLVSINKKSNGSFGTSIAGVPDTNGDGRGDILVGAPSEDGPLAAAGRTYLFSGAVPVTNEPEPTRFASNFEVYPNPIRGAATVRLGLSSSQHVTVVLHDILGREITQLYNGHLTAGTNAIEIDASGLPSGVYFVVASTSSEVTTQRLIRVR